MGVFRWDARILIISPVHDNYICISVIIWGALDPHQQCFNAHLVNKWSKGLIATVYSLEWISPLPAQTYRPTGKQTKHWLHNVLHAVPYGHRHVSLAYGQHGQYFSLTGQYQHVFFSNRTVDSTAIMDIWGIMCPLNKLQYTVYHFQTLLVPHIATLTNHTYHHILFTSIIYSTQWTQYYKAIEFSTNLLLTLFTIHGNSKMATI